MVSDHLVAAQRNFEALHRPCNGVQGLSNLMSKQLATTKGSFVDIIGKLPKLTEELSLMSDLACPGQHLLDCIQWPALHCVKKKNQ